MESELTRIDDQLRLSFDGGAWHGPALLEVLAGVEPDAAHAHPIPEAHSVWEIVLHLGGTYGLILRRLQGDGRQLSPEEDWPTVLPATADGWRESVRALQGLNEELRRAVRGFPAARLDIPLVPEAPYAAYTQFIGVTQHNLYHAGQIALLKRALGC